MAAVDAQPALGGRHHRLPILQRLPSPWCGQGTHPLPRATPLRVSPSCQWGRTSRAKGGKVKADRQVRPGVVLDDGWPFGDKKLGQEPRCREAGPAVRRSLVSSGPRAGPGVQVMAPVRKKAQGGGSTVPSRLDSDVTLGSRRRWAAVKSRRAAKRQGLRRDTGRSGAAERRQEKCVCRQRRQVRAESPRRATPGRATKQALGRGQRRPRAAGMAGASHGLGLQRVTGQR